MHDNAGEPRLTEQPSELGQRVGSVDLVRGVIIALMALDHARDYLVSGDPTNLQETYPALFFTRWVTHFCAPGFVLLAGVSVWLSQTARRRSRLKTSIGLVGRGAVLILLDLILLPFLWWFNFDYSLLPLGVLWAIGWSMIALAMGVFLPQRVLLGIGLVIIFGHNLLDGVSPTGPSLLQNLWAVLHVQTGFRLADNCVVITAYPILPWIGVILFGYGIAPVFASEDRGRKLLVLGGVALTIGFFVLRIANVYGDPVAASFEGNWMMCVMSLLNCTKYPPSLLFLLMTLGPLLILLGLTSRVHGGPLNLLQILGRVPLFFYLTHIPLVHMFGVALSWWKYGRATWWFENPPFPSMPEDYGWSLGVLYLVWLVAMAILFPCCRWYGRWRTSLKLQIAESD